MTPVPSIGGIRDRVKRQIAKDPQMSITGLAESLGISPGSSRQWKSEFVNNTLTQIEDSLGHLHRVAKYLAVTVDEVLFNDGLARDEPPTTKRNSSLADGIAKLTPQDRRLVEALVLRFSERKGNTK